MGCKGRGVTELHRAKQREEEAGVGRWVSDLRRSKGVLKGAVM